MPYIPTNALSTDATRAYLGFGCALYIPLAILGVVSGVRDHQFGFTLFMSGLLLISLPLLYCWWAMRPSKISTWKEYGLSALLTVGFWGIAVSFLSTSPDDPINPLYIYASIVWLGLLAIRIRLGMLSRRTQKRIGTYAAQHTSYNQKLETKRRHKKSNDFQTSSHK